MPRHTAIIKLGTDLGYFSQQDQKGVCHGAVMAWLEACFTHDESLFHQRLLQIKTHTAAPYAFKIKLNQIKSCIETQPNKILSHDEEEIIEIDRFLKQTALYQRPNAKKYHSLFHHPVSQDDRDLVSHLAASNKIKNKGYLITLGTEDGIYHDDELTHYFTALTNIVQTFNHPDHRIGIVLGFNHHAMGLMFECHETQVSWHFMDINMEESIIFHNPSILLKYIRTNHNITTPYLRIQTSILSTGLHPQQQNLKDQLILLHQQTWTLTPDKQLKANHDLTNMIESVFNGLSQHRKLKLLKILPIKQLQKKLFHASPIIPKDILSYLAEHRPEAFNPPTYTQHNPLKEAIRMGLLDVIQNIIHYQNAHPLITDINQIGQTLLHYAAQQGNPDWIDLLLTQDINPHALNQQGYSAAHIAASEGNASFLLKLKERGVQLNSTHHTGNTLLHLAAMRGKTHLISMLLKEGVLLSAQNDDGNTAAHLCIQHYHINFLSTLVLYDIDLSIKNNDGETPGEYIQRRHPYDTHYSNIIQNKTYTHITTSLSNPSWLYRFWSILPGKRIPLMHDLFIHNRDSSSKKQPIKTIICHHITTYLSTKHQQDSKYKVMFALFAFLNDHITWRDVESTIEQNPGWDDCSIFSYVRYIKDSVLYLEFNTSSSSQPL